MATDDEGRPPFFKTWRGAYIFVLVWLAVLVALLSVLSRVTA